ncbi:MAG: hypothetical protein WCK90_06170 [archaeon]
MENTKEEVKVEVNEDAELDKSLQESINSLKAGTELPSKKEEVKPEEPEKEEQKAEDTSKPQVEVEKEVKYDFKLPGPKAKFESDEAYEKRIELLDLVNKRKAAKTPEQRQQISAQIDKTRNEVGRISNVDKLNNPLNRGVETEKKVEVEDETLKADKERLRQLGGATKEDIEEIIRKERQAGEVKSTLDKFVDRHAELKDADTREVFFDFVDSNYNWQNKSGKELMTVLELARESMFKPSETIQERVLKGANVQEKVNAMQFPGGTIAKTDRSPEMSSSIKELVATGMSEEKAIELLS